MSSGGYESATAARSRKAIASALIMPAIQSILCIKNNPLLGHPLYETRPAMRIYSSRRGAKVQIVTAR